MRQYKPLMFLGTASGVGKSLLAAAMCRLAWRRGIGVAPFKAQNMSLNSWVCPGGGEIGRAQALQARACGLAADVRFNPVLLKPMGGQRSQVIVAGRPLGTMTWQEYKGRVREIRRHVAEAWDSLCREYEWIIIEGAGSPAEINLRKDDIANMGMARHARAACLLVADIDRGGAFAALAGTMLLLSRPDRKFISGFILNRFRGDASLLANAIDETSRKTGRPFLGTVPMLEKLRLPEEDSAGLEFRPDPVSAGALDIRVIAWPFASNLTDFAPLGDAARLVGSPRELDGADLLILPGSRNVRASLAWLHENGLADALCAWLRKKGGERHLMGICGGLEALGRAISDPDNVEGGSFQGLDLMPCGFTLRSEKILDRKRAFTAPFLGLDRQEMEGYEIHHGRMNHGARLEPALLDERGHPCGWGLRPADSSVLVWGTWLHGIFDSESFRNAYLSALAARAGKKWNPALAQDENEGLDRLADAVEESLDMGAIARLAGL